LLDYRPICNISHRNVGAPDFLVKYSILKFQNIVE
jgi:hypothetical protein